jgi:glutathione S-transferase
MKLYYAPGTCALAAHIIARETGFPLTLVKTDIKAKTYEGGGDFTKVNPLGYVPVLQFEDGSTITEGPAVLQYIAEKTGSKSVTPEPGSDEYYQMLKWLSFVSGEVHGPFGMLFNPSLPDEAKTFARNKLDVRFKHIEKHLSTNEYLAGSAFSLPDAYLFVVLGWAPAMKIDLSGYPNINAFIARIGSRPAVQKAMEEEGLKKAA